MKNKVIFALAWFLTGAVTGGTVAGVYLASVYKKRLDEALAASEDDEEEEEELSDDDIFDVSDTDSMFPPMHDAISEDIAIDYAALSKRYQSDEFDKSMADRVGPTDDEYDPDGIKMIDAGTFRDDVDYRDNETLEYYRKDDILVDSTNEIIRGRERIIGVECTDLLPDTTDDYLYVDNQNEGKMYEIVIHADEAFRDDE